MVKKFKLPGFGYGVEIGKIACQADGAVWFEQGGTVVIATAVSAESKDFPGFFPLMVDYREQFAAAGKIPGGYYKREGKSSDKEVLTSRLIDRSIRPLFPANYFNSVQILSTVYSVDKKHAPETLAFLASSLALTISDIPFMGPVGMVEIARVKGEWIVNPLIHQRAESDVRLIVAGTKEGICMVEGSMDELSEKEVVDLLFMAHAKIKEQVAWQLEIKKELNIKKAPINDQYHWNHWESLVEKFLTPDRVKSMYIADKVKRNEQLRTLQDEFIAQHEADIEEKETPHSVIDYIFDQILKIQITELIFKLKKRIDGRSFDQIRKIKTEVGLLPFTHGSSLFTRGHTQALVTVTLGGGQDEQRVEGILEGETTSRRFMLNYNFPPFSVGEVRPLRGPGRREVGHGHLAASALTYVLPSPEKFPYTMRVVSDILESDGSSSMATTCGATMALMDAGVPIKEMVGGVAMGLLRSKDGQFIVLSDISGFEDAFGMMDFKVTGTKDGVTALQMDIKYKGGLERAVFEKALSQAQNGRLHILGEMAKVMDKPNKELSDLVPKLVTMQIDPDKIGAIIGGGGKTIREIIEATGTEIDIEPDGLVKIFGGPEADVDRAIDWIRILSGQIDVGSIHDGKIRRIVDFGIFVELVPGQDGLVHVSNIPKDKQRTFMRDYHVGDAMKVEVVDYDPESGRIRLRPVADKRK